MDDAAAAVIRADLVIRLRDLRGEHDTKTWDVPFGVRWPESQWMLTAALLEAAATVMMWRHPADDVDDQAERESELERATNFAHAIAAAMTKEDGGMPSLFGADCTLIVSREPAAEQ